MFEKIKRWWKWHKREKCGSCINVYSVSNWSPCYSCSHFSEYDPIMNYSYDGKPFDPRR